MDTPSIDLKIPEKLRNKNYRQAFFLAESSALIAKQLIALRKRRGLNQTQVADLLETGQPAISRVESADYRNWSFNTLRRLADAMDARLRVIIEPSEDVIAEYERQEIAAASAQPSAVTETTGALSGIEQTRPLATAATASLASSYGLPLKEMPKIEAHPSIRQDRKKPQTTQFGAAWSS